jgi:agmatinase
MGRDDADEQLIDGIVPAHWWPWRDPDDPTVNRLGEQRDALTMRRDTSSDPRREPGLFNPQRYASGVMPMGGFPSFLGAPLAMDTADLKAGKVDAALVGLTIDDNPVPGARFAANEMRTLRDWMSFPPGGTDQFLGVDWGSLRVADYGNIASYAVQNERSLEEVHRVISEILAADTIPIGVGGTHLQSYGYVTALASKYGPGRIMLVHVDAHVDTYIADLGRTIHNGSFLKVAIDKGLLKGDDLVQFGLRGQGPSEANLAWLREKNVRTHFQAEIDTNGWDSALRRILSEVKGRMVYLSFDVDAISPAYAPGVGTQDPDGLTASQALQLVRALAINSDIVAADFIEYNPLLDDAHQTTGVLVDRLIRSLLAGLAARRQGITDPLYIDPRRLDYRAQGAV